MGEKNSKTKKKNKTKKLEVTLYARMKRMNEGITQIK
jgi:hypothetical protein